ncbi:DUF1003 domain-containing protein [Demequina sp. TTPB684]|uniref:DUF1003 domain-containing protein n=1 Tax=unclassified Demequina TaxID=2620311 RepID=UPI001CF12FC9|nr:DUF1003 domain-containing protein [Demequina sp. TMPB413]MCB2412345.1 DUF1003 domain-containing protein [Demequina sp. TTPB684]UPU88502.1 DUF1003 domain-containing protein [Demequina sp. TMPB413]
MAERLDRPKGERRLFGSRPASSRNSDRFGRVSEGIARFIGTPRFLVYLTIFVAAWLTWNVLPFTAERGWRFDSPALYFTALTLVLSLQASYAAPLILLAQNRQDDRDRVSAEQDRQRAERSLEDTAYLAREVAALRQALNETATRDFVRSELRSLLEELRQDERERDRDDSAGAG